VVRRRPLRSIGLMYTPPFNRADDEGELREFVADVRVGWLVTSRVGAAPAASFLPVVWMADTVIAHFAKANPHWREILDDLPALLIVTGPDAYVSPSWYAAKPEHGKVVPTWNYSAVHLTGTARVHEDPEWLRAAVTDLTEQHEESRDRPWQVSDAPAPYIEGQLRGIVGVEIRVTGVEGKAKLSQNRSDADRVGVIDGLRKDGRPGDLAVADAIAASLDEG
jgi:transcriptional regulator